MKNKKGFTLVELLAVIAILGVILLLIVPNIVDMFNEGKKDTFIRQVQSIWKEAEKEYETDLARGRKISVYCDSSLAGDDCRELSLNTTDIKYVVTFDSHGKVTMIGVQDKNYCFTTTDTSSMDISHDSLAQKESLNCSSSGCTCGSSSGNLNPVDLNDGRYAYWDLNDFDDPENKDIYESDEMPSSTHISYNGLQKVFVRTTLGDNKSIEKHEVCSYGWGGSSDPTCFSSDDVMSLEDIMNNESAIRDTFAQMAGITSKAVAQDSCHELYEQGYRCDYGDYSLYVESNEYHSLIGMCAPGTCLLTNELGKIVWD